MTLIKSMIQAIPIFMMSAFRVPLGVCQDLDASFVGFGGKIVAVLKAYWN